MTTETTEQPAAPDTWIKLRDAAIAEMRELGVSEKIIQWLFFSPGSWKGEG